MNLLLDTAAFLWLCTGAKDLSPSATAALANPANMANVSAITAWEIGIKVAKGKLMIPVPLESWFPAMMRHHRLILLPIEASTAIASTQLPSIHADPFDRLLIALAAERSLRLLTPDPLIAAYPGIQTLW